jgi:hypothetical protein
MVGKEGHDDEAKPIDELVCGLDHVSGDGGDGNSWRARYLMDVSA